jgi:hypothetical protein
MHALLKAEQSATDFVGKVLKQQRLSLLRSLTSTRLAAPTERNMKAGQGRRIFNDEKMPYLSFPCATNRLILISKTNARICFPAEGTATFPNKIEYR